MSIFKFIVLVFVLIITVGIANYYIHNYRIGLEVDRIIKVCNEITLYQHNSNIVIENKLRHMYNNIMEHRKQKHLSYDLFKDIYQMANAHNFDFPLLLAMIETESSFRPRAMSKHAIGIMQINYFIWSKVYPKMTKERLKTVPYNIKIGIDIFRYYENKYGSVEEALLKYNSGESGKYNNEKYVVKVLKIREKYKNIIKSIKVS